MRIRKRRIKRKCGEEKDENKENKRKKWRGGKEGGEFILRLRK